MKMHRRDWMRAALGGAGVSLAAAQNEPLALKDFEPRSMLKVRQTQIERARYPVIDIHTHLSWGARDASTEPHHNATPAEVLPVMDRRNVRIMVNLTGGAGEVLDKTVAYWHKPHPKRFLVFTEPWFSRASETGYATMQAGEIERAHRAGARGLKVLKTLGLFLREPPGTGRLVAIDDRRFDPMWEVCGALNMPVAIHSSDPRAFFLPTDRFNERYEELSAHPDWSFYGRDFPTNEALQQARLRVIARHRRTQFIALHVADPEDLGFVGECLDRHSNMHVEIGARIGELGRQPRTARRFIERYQDRVLFGTDAVPKGVETPQQIFGDELYRIYFRFLETEDEYFDYAPWPVPPQGRWRIYGLGLPDAVLKQIYHDNAARLLGLRPL